MPSPPNGEGQYLGQVEVHDGAVWVWTAAGWLRDEDPPTGNRPLDRPAGPDEL